MAKQNITKSDIKTVTSPSTSDADANGKQSVRKTTCPVSRKEFRGSAKPLTVKVGDRDLTAAVKEFSTGSLGWNVNEKITLEVGGKLVTVQVGMNLTIVGSKELPAESV